MAYATEEEIKAAIPEPHLTDALDDDGDGAADEGMLEQVLASASNAVDAYLASLFPVPFTEPAPAAVREAAQVFACELIYLRRGVGEKNPFGARADYWRDTLRKIGSGEIPLDAAREKAFAPGAAVTETEQLDGTTG